jgi:SAM-dependent methyltransferase
VRKVFLSQQLAGESTEYWESEWAALDLEGEQRMLARGGDPTLEILRRWTPCDGRVLEAGCGSGRYAAALRQPGRRIIGIDLTQRSLQRAASTWPDLDFVAGDIREMPFRANTFSAVISLGVVEHLEEGPQAAIAEHVRVLAPGGVLLISVPSVSPLKAALDTWSFGVRRQPAAHSRGRLVTRTHELTRSPGPGAFHQYEFPTKRWHRLLNDAGLNVVTDEHHLVSAGIGELTTRPPFSRLTGSSTPTTTAVENSLSPDQPGRPQGLIGSLKRAVLREQPQSGWENLAAAGSRRVFGHMILTVAHKSSA